MTTQANARITFQRTPRGLPVVEDFGREVVPASTPAEGQFVARTLWLSLASSAARPARTTSAATCVRS